MTEVEIVEPGPLTTIQDLGRPGLARLGVGRSGAADRGSAKLANRLVGNREDAALLETTYGGLHLRALGTVLLACTGAPCELRLAGRLAGQNAPLTLGAGDLLELGAPWRGLRAYLALRGGVAVRPVLGSRSTDLLSGLGPAPLAAGDRLPVGDLVAGFPLVEVAPVAPPPDPPLLRLLAGPRDDWFEAGALDRLSQAPYEVTPQSNRVGLRLHGAPLARRLRGELPSEGMVAGALQVPPDGQPILFLADHPVTGGYPVIAVVVDRDLDAAGQARAGDRLRFRLAVP